MKKIMIVANTSWFIFNFFRSSISEFMRDGNQVFVLAPRDAYTDRLINLGCIYKEIEVFRSGINPYQELKTFYKLYRIQGYVKPDVVLNFTPKINIYSTITAKLHRIPVVNSVAGLGSIFTEVGFKSFLGKSLLRLTQPFANHIIFQNPDDWNIYLESQFVKKECSSRVHGIGINLEYFKPHCAPDDNVVRFILVARMLKNKGVIDFVNAAVKVDEHYKIRKLAGFSIPEYSFSLLGFVDEENPQGIPLEQLQQWHNNTVVNYLGATDDVYNIVKSQDCVVLPSYYREGVPQCLIEACAMAKPIITTDNVGCRETVTHDESGYIVPPRSVPELKEAMIKMIEIDHQDRLNFGRNGHEKAVRDFCHLKISRHYLDIIENVISSVNLKIR